MNTEKKRIMLHIIMPNQISGPNTTTRRIAESYLADEYEFSFLEQRYHAGGKINIRLISDLYHQIKEADPEFVHLAGLQSAGFHAVVAARLAKKKVLLTIHGFSVDDMSSHWLKRWVFGAIIEPLTLCLSTKIYTVCDYAKNRPEIQRFSKKVLPTIHNAAPASPDATKALRGEMRQVLGLNEEDVAIVISGRMTNDKGIPTIIEAIQKQRAVKEYDKVRYVFIGDGPALDAARDSLTDEIGNGKVLLLGKRNDVLSILSACDIFLFATLHENLSNALLESMACKLPAIVTAVGGNVEVVADGVNGYLIPPNDAVTMNERIMELALDPDKRQRFGEASLRIIRESFTQEDLYKQVKNYYELFLDM